MQDKHTTALALILVSLAGITVFAGRAHVEKTEPPAVPALAAAPQQGETAAPTPSTPPATAVLSAPAPAQEPVAQELRTTPASSSAPESATLATMTVHGTGTAIYTLTGEDGSTLLDAMRELAARDPSFAFVSREFSGMGAFVESISGLANGDGHYWIVSVNGTKSALGVSSILLHPGDNVEWRYEKGY